MPSTKVDTPGHIVPGGVYKLGTVTIRVTEILSARRMESGVTMVIVYAWRVRPYDHSVSFGRQKVYVASPDRYVKVG